METTLLNRITNNPAVLTGKPIIRGLRISVEQILKCQGKVILTGIGKSGQIGRKMSSTFSSTGTPSVFLHPAESSHGDLGVIAKTDLVIAVSYGGEAAELHAILNHISRNGIFLISLTGKPELRFPQIEKKPKQHGLFLTT